MGQEQAYTGCPFRAGPDHSVSPTRGTNVTSRRSVSGSSHAFPSLWTETKAIRHSFELSADSRRMGDTSQTSWTFGMGSTAIGSEESRTAGGTLGRSGRVLGGTGGRIWKRIFVVWFGVFDNHLFDARLRVGRLQANFGGRLRT